MSSSSSTALSIESSGARNSIMSTASTGLSKFRSRTSISLSPRDDAFADFDHYPSDELPTYDPWQRSEIKRQARAESALTALTWVTQQPSSRPAPHVHVPWESMHSRRHRASSILGDFEHAFRNKTAVEISLLDIRSPRATSSVVPGKPTPKPPSQGPPGESRDGIQADSTPAVPVTHHKRSLSISGITRDGDVDSDACFFTGESSGARKRARIAAKNSDAGSLPDDHDVPCEVSGKCRQNDFEAKPSSRRKTREGQQTSPGPRKQGRPEWTPTRQEKSANGCPEDSVSHGRKHRDSLVQRDSHLAEFSLRSEGGISHLATWHNFSDDQFEMLWPYCFFHAFDPDQYASDTWKPCRTPKTAISHVVSHTVQRHGMIRGLHRQGPGNNKRYLVMCRDSYQQHKGRESCSKCMRIPSWTRDELEAFSGTHSGPSLCLRCYEALDSRKELWFHMRTNTLCPDRGQSLSKRGKARILYSTFCSSDVPPRWAPPQERSDGNVCAVSHPAPGGYVAKGVAQSTNDKSSRDSLTEIQHGADDGQQLLRDTRDVGRADFSNTDPLDYTVYNSTGRRSATLPPWSQANSNYGEAVPTAGVADILSYGSGISGNPAEYLGQATQPLQGMQGPDFDVNWHTRTPENMHGSLCSVGNACVSSQIPPFWMPFPYPLPNIAQNGWEWPPW